MPIHIPAMNFNDLPRCSSGKCDRCGKENSGPVCVIIGTACVERDATEAWLDVCEGRDMNKIGFFCIPCRQRIAAMIDIAIGETTNGSCENA